MSKNDEYSPIRNLPEEILLRIFRFILPYKDYASIRLVCRQWERLWREIHLWRYKTFAEGLSCSSSPVSIHWHLIDPPLQFNLIPRFSHSTCYVDSQRMLYVFGGSPDIATALNDFWRLDLSTRSWTRILPTGNYPSPKCSATLIDDENGHLLLFGGRSMIYIDDVHIREQLHSELHSYSMEKNSWTLHVSLNEPGSIADHSASIVKMNNEKRMIIFGGLITQTDQTFQRTNNLWQWTDTWTLIDVNGIRPEPRRGHSQFTINDQMIFIVGGSSSTGVCSDVWLFSLLTHQWTQIDIRNCHLTDFIPTNDDLSFAPFSFVRSSEILITFGRLKRHPTEPQRHSYSQYDFSHCDDQSQSHSSVSLASSSSDENDEKILRSSTASKRLITPVKPTKYNLMEISSGFQMYRLDLSNLFSINPFVQWLPSKCTTVFGSPIRSSLHYSLACARSELVLFGGIDKRQVYAGGRSREKIFRPKFGTLAIITLSNIPL